MLLDLFNFCRARRVGHAAHKFQADASAELTTPGDDDDDVLAEISHFNTRPASRLYCRTPRHADA